MEGIYQQIQTCDVKKSLKALFYLETFITSHFNLKNQQRTLTEPKKKEVKQLYLDLMRSALYSTQPSWQQAIEESKIG